MSYSGISHAYSSWWSHRSLSCIRSIWLSAIFRSVFVLLCSVRVLEGWGCHSFVCWRRIRKIGLQEKGLFTFIRIGWYFIGFVRPLFVDWSSKFIEVSSQQNSWTQILLDRSVFMVVQRMKGFRILQAVRCQRDSRHSCWLAEVLLDSVGRSQICCLDAFFLLNYKWMAQVVLARTQVKMQVKTLFRWQVRTFD